MATFWTWAVRNPCLAVACLGLASGFTAVVDWSAAMLLTMIAVVLGDSAHHLASKARERERRRLEADEAARSARDLRTRFVDPDPRSLRKAA